MTATTQISAQLSDLERQLVTVNGQLKSAARQALAAAGEIQALLALIHTIESQGN